MKSLAQFNSERNSQNWRVPAVTPLHGRPTAELHPEVRATAYRGLWLFPVPEITKITGDAEFLIAEASRDVIRLEELAAEYASDTWRVAIGPSQLCVVEVAGAEARASLAAMNQNQEDCSTLRVERGGMTWALFRWPKGLVLCGPPRCLPSGVRILGNGDSCPVPPSPSCRWTNPWAEIESVPVWLRELVFSDPGNSPGKAASVPERSPRSAPCRSTVRFEKPHRHSGIGFPTPDQAGWRGGFRVSRRR